MPSLQRRCRLFACTALVAMLAACAGTLVHKERSAYSHIQVRDLGERRALYFVGDADPDVVETLIDLREPHVLQHAYSRTVMAALLYRGEVRSCLMIGLGGGAIVRFLNHHFPDLRLDVVEIDAAVVRVARTYFGLNEPPGTRIHVADGRAFLERDGPRYDLILIDAHLHPDAQTDSTGHPLSLKSTAFHESVRRRLAPGGIAMFNVIGGRDEAAYIESIRSAFAVADVYRTQHSGNVIVFVPGDGILPDEPALRRRARMLDRRGGFGFSFEALLDARDPATAGR